MSWRKYLDHNSLIESTGGRHGVDTNCSDSQVALLGTMLESAITNYQHLCKLKVCENKQTSYVLKESIMLKLRSLLHLWQ